MNSCHMYICFAWFALVFDDHCMKLLMTITHIHCACASPQHVHVCSANKKKKKSQGKALRQACEMARVEKEGHQTARDNVRREEERRKSFNFSSVDLCMGCKLLTRGGGEADSSNGY